MLNLSLTEKGGTTNELSFDKSEVTIGRVRGNDIVLPKGNVSKHHCRIVLSGDDMVIEDLRSTNGTYVNGRKIASPTVVSLSDKIFVGDFIIRLTAVTAAEPVRPSFPVGPPEAGSLSSAIPRRPPPPPPPSRAGAMDDMLGGAGRMPAPAYTPPPPPLPPAPSKRESKPMPVLSEAYAQPLGTGTNIDLDDEEGDSLGTPRPHFNVPPLRPAVQIAPPSSDLEALGELESGPGTPLPPGEEAVPAVPSDDGEPPMPPEAADENVLEAPPGPARAATSELAALDRAPISPRAKARPTVGVKPVHKQLDHDLPEWLAELLGGEGVTAVFLTEPDQAEVQRHGQRESVPVSAADIAGLGAAVRRLASKVSPRPDPEATTINVTLPDGMHIAAIFPPAADRLCVAVRRPIASGKTIDDLVADDVMSPQMRQVLDACVTARQNILVSGDRAACDGLLRAILWSIDRMARVVLLSDAITPPASASSWVRLRPEAATPDLVAAAVAMQPDYLIADANHSSLAGEILAECDLGQKGAIFSCVARSSSDALSRLRCLGGKQAPGALAADRIGACVALVLQASVLADGSLKVVEMAEPKESLDGQVAAHALLSWVPGDGAAGSFTASGVHSRLAAKLAAAGIAIPTEILTRR